MSGPVELISRGCPAPYVEAVEARLAERRLGAGGRVALVLCHDPDQWAALAGAVAEDLIVIAVLGRLDVADYARALAAGADGVVYVDTSSAITADVVAAALQGEVLLPTSAAQGMARLVHTDTEPEPSVDTSELELLRLLAGGSTVLEAARHLHYSERTVRRRVQNICLRLGVSSRSEAIAVAARRGWLD